MFIVNESKTNYLPAWRRLVESFPPSWEFRTGNVLRKMSGLVCFVSLCAYPSDLVFCGLLVVQLGSLVISISMSVSNVC